MERALVVAGFAIGAVLRAAHDRGAFDRIPRPYKTKWDETLTRGVSVGWFGYQVDVIERKRSAA